MNFFVELGLRRIEIEKLPIEGIVNCTLALLCILENLYKYLLMDTVVRDVIKDVKMRGDEK